MGGECVDGRNAGSGASKTEAEPSVEAAPATTTRPSGEQTTGSVATLQDRRGGDARPQQSHTRAVQPDICEILRDLCSDNHLNKQDKDEGISEPQHDRRDGWGRVGHPDLFPGEADGGADSKD